MTATPLSGGDGQKRELPVAKSAKPQWPTYAKPLYSQTSALNPRMSKLLWPTTSMFKAEPAFEPLS